jgi:UDP-glucose 4-epimerase
MDDLVVITGGAGFIGSHLARGFSRNGTSVRVVDNLSTGSLTNLESIRDRIEFLNVDIRDLDTLTESFRNASIVLHHAGVSSVERSFADRDYTYDVNATGTLNVLLAAVRADVRKVINASSSSVYGNSCAGLQTETATPGPVSPYGFSKWISELYATQIAKTNALQTVSFRYFNVFGPRQNSDSGYAAVIPSLIRSVADGSSPIIFGDGTQTRDFTFVDNIVEANLRAAQRSIAPGTIVNVATGRRLSINELVIMLGEILGTEIQPIRQQERAGDIKHSCADIAKSEELLGVYNVTPFLEGLAETVRWFLQCNHPGRLRAAVDASGTV